MSPIEVLKNKNFGLLNFKLISKLATILNLKKMTRCAAWILFPLVFIEPYGDTLHKMDTGTLLPPRGTKDWPLPTHH